MLSKLLKEKGDLPIASLTLNELKLVFDKFKEGISNIAPDLNQDNLLTSDQLIKEIGISRSTLYRLRKEGSIPEYQVGKKIRFKLEEVKDAMIIKIIDPSFSS